VTIQYGALHEREKRRGAFGPAGCGRRLIGGASLNAEEFLQIIKAANQE
jgi:triosephosphate isomerase